MLRLSERGRRCLIAAGALASLVIGAAASAGQVFNLSDGTYSAQVTFNVSGGQLEITIKNTMTNNSANPKWICGLFFDIAGSPTLTYDPSGLDGDIITLNGTTQTPYNTHDADQLWAYRDDIGGAELPFGSMEYGLGAAGFGVFGPADMLIAGGPHPQPDGSDGGILPDIAGLTVPGGHEDRPMILDSLTLVFDIEGDPDDLNISNVAVVFGTSFDEVVVLVPVPAALPIGLAGLAGLGLFRLRRRSA